MHYLSDVRIPVVVHKDVLLGWHLVSMELRSQTCGMVLVPAIQVNM